MLVLYVHTHTYIIFVRFICCISSRFEFTVRPEDCALLSYIANILRFIVSIRQLFRTNCSHWITQTQWEKSGHLLSILYNIICIRSRGAKYVFNIVWPYKYDSWFVYATDGDFNIRYSMILFERPILIEHSQYWFADTTIYQVCWLPKNKTPTKKKLLSIE